MSSRFAKKIAERVAKEAEELSDDMEIVSDPVSSPAPISALGAIKNPKRKRDVADIGPSTPSRAFNIEQSITASAKKRAKKERQISRKLSQKLNLTGGNSV